MGGRRPECPSSSQEFVEVSHLQFLVGIKKRGGVIQFTVDANMGSSRVVFGCSTRPLPPQLRWHHMEVVASSRISKPFLYHRHDWPVTEVVDLVLVDPRLTEGSIERNFKLNRSSQPRRSIVSPLETLHALFKF